MADIFKEVDEELRRDNFAKLWKKYGRAILGLALAIVLAVAGVQGWRAYDLDQGCNTPQNRIVFFEEARLRVASGDIQGAIRVWDQIAADSGLGQGFSNVAEVLSVMHQIDSGDATVLRGRLEPLAVDGAPFRATARELLALIALRQGDRAGARELYTRIADDREAPSGLRARAAQMLAALKD